MVLLNEAGKEEGEEGTRKEEGGGERGKEGILNYSNCISWWIDICI